tara:strand:- start:890 stop:1378 length:489 start_codon:yes stop_codon:yes gene_type:complete
MRNICFIGLPYSGKSNLGKKLSLIKNRKFIETDNILKERYGKINNIIKKKGVNKFLFLENKCALSVNCNESIISTGGSMIYNNEAMQHFKYKLNSDIIHLELSLDEFKNRIKNLEKRGVVNPNNLNLEELYYERINLCNFHSDIVIKSDNKLKTFDILKNYI